MRILDRVLTMAAVLALPVVGIAAWKGISGTVTTIHQWNQNRDVAALAESLLTHLGAERVVANPGATRTVIEVLDYECPGCRGADSLVQTVFHARPDLRLGILHMPLSGLHPRARAAARASICAGGQPWFQDYHHTLLSHRVPEEDSGFWPLARQVGAIDSALFDACLGSSRPDQVLKRDSVLVDRLRVKGTPTFISPDARMVGMDFLVTLAQEQ